MAWYDEAIFYHIYPLGMTGAPKHNNYGAVEHRLNTLTPFISEIKKLGFSFRIRYDVPKSRSQGSGCGHHRQVPSV